MPTSAALKLVGDQHVGQILEHLQLSMGGPVPSTQVLHSRPELGGDEVTSPSSSSPGIYLGMHLPPPSLPSSCIAALCGPTLPHSGCSILLYITVFPMATFRSCIFGFAREAPWSPYAAALASS